MNKNQVCALVVFTVYMCWNIGIWITHDEEYRVDRSVWASWTGVIIIFLLLIFIIAGGFFDAKA